MGFKQGKYIPKNPEKYMGDTSDIVYRSSWEYKFMNYLDFNPAVLKWGSETVVVPYFFELDQKMHRYFVDFIMSVRNSAGDIVTYLVEIKPKKDTIAKQPKRMTEKAKANYMKSIYTMEKNKAKWEAAKKFASENNMIFKVITEDELF